MSPLVVTIGEPVVAFVAEDVGSFGTGGRWRSVVTGAEVNVSIGLSRLGITSTFIGPVGNDDLGGLVRDGLRAEGVDTTCLQTVESKPTAALVRSRRLNGAGSVNYLRSDSAGSLLALDQHHIQRIKQADVVHVSGITPALSEQAQHTITQAMSTTDSLVTLDVNYRSRLWTESEAKTALTPLAAVSDVVFADIGEAQVLTGSLESDPRKLAVSVCALGPSHCVMKLGPTGAAVYDKSEDRWHRYEGTPASLVIDPIGAGDAFVAGFIAATVNETQLSDTLRWGHICGSMCVGALGDTAGAPKRIELDRALTSSDADITR